MLSITIQELYWKLLFTVDEVNKDGAEDGEGNNANPRTESRSDEYDDEDDDHIKDLAEQEERAKEKNNINKMLEDYTYDEEHHMWCQLTFNVSLISENW